MCPSATCSTVSGWVAQNRCVETRANAASVKVAIQAAALRLRAWRSRLGSAEAGYDCSIPQCETDCGVCGDEPGVAGCD